MSEDDRRKAAVANVVAAVAREREATAATAKRLKDVAGVCMRTLDPQRWIDALQEAIQQHERLGLVPSLFDVMGLSDSERHHNRVLAWLLDSDADHGAGRQVLRALARGLECKVLEEDVADPGSKIEVRGEMCWPEGAGSSLQPDLLVLAPRALLLIENKVWSGETGNQYADYAAAFQRLAKERGVIEQRMFLAAREKRETPKDWTGMVLHHDLARWLSEAAQAEGMTPWGRVLCLLVAEEIADRKRAEHLQEAKHLRASIVQGHFRAADVRRAQKILEGLGDAVAPWRD